jgi:hypothetical protein
MRRRWQVVLGLIWLLSATPVAAPPPVTLTVYPQVAHAPATFRVSIRIEKHPDNRELWLLWEGPRSGRTGLESIDERDPAQYVWTDRLADLPAGEYTAQAFLIRTNSVHQSAAIPFTVLGPQ